MSWKLSGRRGRTPSMLRTGALTPHRRLRRQRPSARSHCWSGHRPRRCQRDGSPRMRTREACRSRWPDSSRPLRCGTSSSEGTKEVDLPEAATGQAACRRRDPNGPGEPQMGLPTHSASSTRVGATTIRRILKGWRRA